MINSHQERLNSFSDEICEYFSLSKEDLAAEGLFSVSEDLYCMRIVNNDRSLSVISRKRCLLACTNCNHRVCLWGKRDPGEKPDTSKLDTRHYENCKSHERLKKDFHNVCYDDRTVRTKSYRIVNPILENPPRDIDIRFLTDICPDSYIDVFDENNKKNALMITDLEINEILRKIAKHQTENNIIKHVNLIKEDDYNYCTRVNTLSKIDEKYYDASDLKIYIDKYSELLEQVPKPLTQKQSILCSLFDTAKTELPIIYGAYRILTCLFENGENINDSCFRKSIKHNMVTQHVEAVSRGGALLREVVEQNLPTPSDGSPPTAESKLGNGKYSLAASLSEDCQNEDVIGINTVVTAWPLLEAEKEYRGICEVGNALVSELTKITFVNNASYQAISRRKFAFV